MRSAIVVAALACACACACGSKRASGPSCDDLRPMVDRMYEVEASQVRGGLTPAQAKRVQEVGVQVAPAMKAAIVDACRADGWPADVIACMSAARGESALDECESRLPASARKRVEDAMSEVVTHIQPPDEPAGAASDDDDRDDDSGVPACDAYAAAMRAYLACDAIGDDVKDAARAGLAQLRQTWAMLRDPSTPASARDTAARACDDARATLAASAKKQGCAIAADCTVLGPMIQTILAEQLRGVPADKQAAAAAHARALAAPLEQALVATCTKEAWSPAAATCFGAAHSGAALAACQAQLTPAQARALAQAMEQVTTTLAGGGGAHVQACDEYLAAVNALVACDKLPADDRAHLQQASALVIDGLRKISGASVPAAQDIAATCAKALADTRALAARVGC